MFIEDAYKMKGILCISRFFMPGKKFFLLLLRSLLAITSLAQPAYDISMASQAEKVYLQLDSKVYTTDESIWFKAIVANAASHEPTRLSGVLYVELISPNETILEKKLIKLENGIGDGFIQLYQSYSEGLYMVRAYTQWDENFGNDFFFKEYIHVISPTNEVTANPITHVTLLEQPDNERLLGAVLDPFVLDSLHKHDLTLVLSLNKKTDTIAIRKNKDNQYVLNYAIPEGCQFVTLQMQTKNHFSFSKTIALDKDFLDLQFFPESGELVEGLQSVVGFKALDCNGRGKKVEGEIVNEKGEMITLFKSNDLGMGTFTLANADTGVHLSARLLPAQEDGVVKMYPLPEVAGKGNILSVKKDSNLIRLKAISNYMKDDSLTVLASCRGVVYYIYKGKLKDGRNEFSFAEDLFPEGIIDFTMLDMHLHAVAERLYFNLRPENRINLEISTDKESYLQREPAHLTVETTDYKGYPVNANVSVLVVNKAQMGKMQDTRQNIISYFLVSSDLKGEIENPGYYFTNENDRFDDLDALLLTQGWRKYNYAKPVVDIRLQPQSKLTVSGKVSSAISGKKKKKGISLTLMAFGHDHFVEEQIADSLGRFCFDMNDEFGQNLKILIQSAKKDGKKKDYTIMLDKKESPVISFNHVKSIENPDSIVHSLVEKNIERKKVDDAFLLSKGDILLDEVTIQGYRMTPARKKMAEKYGKPDEVIDGKAIQEKEEKWSYGLV